MRRNSCFVLTVLCLSASTFIFGQNMIAVRDVKEIQFASNQLIRRTLQDELNLLSNVNTPAGSFDSKSLIDFSYTNNSTQIFYDSSIIIEDDIDPQVDYTQAKNKKDLTVETYLKNFDLWYDKSDSASVKLDSVRVSDVKMTDYIYTRVYYKCFFQNKNNTVNAFYKPVYRVADVKFDRKDKKWKGYIIGINFFNPADTANDITNNLAVRHDTPAETGSSTAASQEDSLLTISMQRETDAFNENLKKYKNHLLSGSKYLGSKDYQNAYREYKKAFDINPDPSDMYASNKMNEILKTMSQSTISDEDSYKDYINRAKRAELTRNYETAIGLYQEALKVKPDEKKTWDNHIKDLTAQFSTINVLEEKYKAGKYSEAKKEYDKAIKNNKTNSDLYLGRGKCNQAMDNNKSAMEDYTNAINTDHANLEALQLRAEMYVGQKKYPEAISDYNVYLVNDKDPKIFKRKAEIYVMSSQVTSAFSELNKSIEVDSTYAPVYFYKAQLQLQQSPPDYRNALYNFDEAVTFDTASAVNYYKRGICEYYLGSVPEAASDFEIARKKGLDSANRKSVEDIASVIDYNALTYAGKGMSDSAMVAINNAIAVNPYSAMFRFQKGELYYNLRLYDDAIKNYNDAVRLNPRYNEAFFKKSLAYYNLGQYDNAIGSFAGVLALSPNDVLSIKGKGDSYFNLKKYDSSIIFYESCLKTSRDTKFSMPDSVRKVTYNNLGKSYYKTYNYSASKDNLDKAIKIDESYPEAHFNRSNTLYAQNELSDAVDDIKKALEADAKNPSWNYTAGEVCRAKKDFGNAVSYYSSAVSYDTLKNFENAFYYRGYCYRQQNDFVNALPDYQKILDLQTDTSFKSFYNELGGIYLNLQKFDSGYYCYNVAYTRDNNDAYALYGMAASLVLQNKTDDGTIDKFKQAFASKTISKDYVKKDKLIDGIRNDKRFKSLMKEYY